MVVFINQIFTCFQNDECEQRNKISNYDRNFLRKWDYKHIFMYFSDELFF